MSDSVAAVKRRLFLTFGLKSVKKLAAVQAVKVSVIIKLSKSGDELILVIKKSAVILWDSGKIIGARTLNQQNVIVSKLGYVRD